MKTATLYCECETPVMDVMHDAACRRCGLPVDFSPSWGNRDDDRDAGIDPDTGVPYDPPREAIYRGRCLDCADEWTERTAPAICPECHSLSVEDITGRDEVSR